MLAWHSAKALSPSLLLVVVMMIFFAEYQLSLGKDFAEFPT
jgi:hypothetical protein